MELGTLFRSSLDEYREQEMDNHQRLVGYHENKRSNMLDISGIIGKLERSQSKYLYAINHYSRIAMMEQLVDVVGDSLEIDHEQFWFLTFTPKRYAIQLRFADQFKPADLKKMIGQYMQGLHYIGMVEPAFYPRNSSGNPTSDHIVHFHAHLLAWGGTKLDMDGITTKYNGKHRSIVPGRPAFDARPAEKSHIVKILAYMTKSPRCAYTCYNPDVVKFDKETGEIIDVYRQKKRILEKREAAELALCIQDFTLDGLLLGGGDGAKIITEARKRMLKPLHNAEAIKRWKN